MKFRFAGTPRVRFAHPTREGITVDLTVTISSEADLHLDKTCGVTECEVPDSALRELFRKLADGGTLTVIDRAG